MGSYRARVLIKRSADFNSSVLVVELVSWIQLESFGDENSFRVYVCGFEFVSRVIDCVIAAPPHSSSQIW